VRSIVSALAMRLTAADTERSLRKPAANLAAYDLYLRAAHLDGSYNPGSCRQAKELASQAVALDPGFARAYTMLATEIFSCGWFENAPPESYLDEALRAAAKAVELDPDDSFCVSTLAITHLQRREFDQARHYFDLALKSNPNDVVIWADYAWFLTSVGRSEEALERLDSKENFEPYPPHWHWEIRGQVLYALKRYDEARTSFERMSVIPFWVKGLLAACCGQLGDTESAERYWAEALEAAPNLSSTGCQDCVKRRSWSEDRASPRYRISRVGPACEDGYSTATPITKRTA
jgi:adenylate cyclase